MARVSQYKQGGSAVYKAKFAIVAMFLLALFGMAASEAAAASDTPWRRFRRAELSS